MRYVLRADASQSIGSGHVMRLSAIAEEFIGRGEEVIFVGHFSDVPWLALRINSLGFSKILHSEGEFISDPETDVLILDSYMISVENEFIQKVKWKKIVAIADTLTPAYQSHLEIRPGLTFGKEYVSKNKVLEGPRFIPFRKSIQGKKGGLTPNAVLEILVVGGGTDSFNFVAAVCKVLSEIREDFHVNIFTNQIGLEALDSRFTTKPIGSELDQYAEISDLVFTTASTSSLEFLSRGVAVGIGCAIDNQADYYETLSSAGVAIPIGKFTEGSWHISQSKVSELVSSKQLRLALRKKCSGLIDLEGSKRIVDEILTL